MADEPATPATPATPAAPVTQATSVTPATPATPAAPAGLAAAAVAAAAAPKPGDPPATPVKDGERPEWLPEQFWDKDKKTTNTEALVTSWKDTRKALDAKGSKAPAKAEDYKFEAAKDAKYGEIKADDPLMAVFRTAAHKHGIPQEAFQGIVSEVLAGIFEGMPEPMDPAKELEKLGKNGQAVVDNVVGWITGLETGGTLSKDEADEMIRIGATANGIKALSKIMARAGEKSIPLDSAPAGEGLPSKEELYAAVRDPKYQTDPAYREKIDAQFKKVFGTQPASSSQPGLGVASPRRAVG